LVVRCFAEGLYVRWGGDTLQFAPPLTCTSNDLERMGDVLKKVFRTLK